MSHYNILYLIKYTNYFINKKILKYILLIIFFLFIFKKNLTIKNPKKIGVIGVRHEINIGNNLLKYAIFIKLKEFGFKPYIIGTHWKNFDISFVKKKTKCIIIKKNFSEIKKNYFDILMVNSDQTWRKFDKHFYDYGFLRFAKNWKIPKFVYGASLGFHNWRLTKKDEIIIKELLKDFTGISVREEGSIKLINKHLGINPVPVLDPTFLINKKKYLELINNFISDECPNSEYIFVYVMNMNSHYKKYMKYASKMLNYKTYKIKIRKKNLIERFIYGLTKSRAVITDSFHGTIFSIIFNKPFISFIRNARERFFSLVNTFHIKNRIFEKNQFPNVNLLNTPLNINYTLFNLLKKKNIDYIKKNLKLI